MAEKEGDSPQPPSKLPRLSAADSNAGAVTMAVSSPLVLGLGLALGGDNRGERGVEAQATAKSVLTFMQQQELEHQVLIYRYFAAGAPVPVHLVLPIWKSVAASSFGPHRFPSLVGLGSLCFDYRSSMEPEPGRCRRTDGKKWRCSRDVVQGHKYCERHVHRGRSRSRKPVEGASSAATAAPAHNGGITEPPRGLGFSPPAASSTPPTAPPRAPPERALGSERPLPASSAMVPSSPPRGVRSFVMACGVKEMV